MKGMFSREDFLYGFEFLRVEVCLIKAAVFCFRMGSNNANSTLLD